jgi:hypothetical protein
MSNVSDDRLKHIFRKKLKNYEPLPPEASWERIQGKLPTAQSSTSRVVSGSIITLFLLTSVLFPLTPILFRGTTAVGNYLSSSEQQKLATTESGRPDSLDFASLDSTQMLHTLPCNQDVTAGESTNKSESGRIGTTRSNKQRGAFIVKSVTPDSIFHASPKVESCLNFSLSKTSLIYFSQVELPQLDEIALVRFDSLSRRQNERSRDEADKSTQQKRAQKPLAGYPVLRMTTFYNSGVFTPLLADAVRVDRFSQSKRLLTNRVGFMVEIGYHNTLFDQFHVEYFAGYKFFSKELEYTTTVVEERTTEQTVHRISGLTHVLRTGVAIRPSFQPVIFSVAYEKAFGSFTVHTGNQLINLGLGAEKKINSRISLRPGISYGISIDGVIRHFNYKPIGWNLEIAWKLGDTP